MKRKEPGEYLSFSERKKMLLRLIRQNLKKLPKSDKLRIVVGLVQKHFKVLAREPMWIRELYLQILAAGSTPKMFIDYLTDFTFENNFWREVALHNFLVKQAFEACGINWDKWSDCNFIVECLAPEYEKMSGRDDDWLCLSGSLLDLEKAFSKTPLAGSIRKDCIEICKKKNQILSGKLRVDGNYFKILFPKYVASVEYFKRKNKEIVLTEEMANPYVIMEEIAVKIMSFYREPEMLKFRVKIWDRMPMQDIFQGNTSECCIAIGKKSVFPAIKLPGVDCKKYPAGILQYLIDLGIQVAEVQILIRDDTWMTCGQCWLYVSLDEKSAPVLVADSFDLQSAFQSGKVNQEIRDCMFQFLARYAQSCGIRKVVLGKSGPMLIEGPKTGTFHGISNEVETDVLDVIKFESPLDKLGGYFLGKKYFLETCGGRDGYLVYDYDRLSPFMKIKSRYEALVNS